MAVQDERLTLREAADRAGVSPSTLRRWAENGLIPEADGGADGWTGAAAAHARARDRRGRARDAVRRRRAVRGLPAGGLSPAMPRLRPGPRPDRRRRGAPLPHLRA